MSTQNDEKQLTNEQFEAALDAWVASKNPETGKKSGKQCEQGPAVNEATIDAWVKTKQ